MLVMPEFFTYRSLKRMTGGCKDVAILRGSALPGALLTQVCSAEAAIYASVLDSFLFKTGLGGDALMEGWTCMRGACRW